MPARILVRDYMSTRLTLLKPDMELQRAVHILLENSVSGAPVIDDDRNLVGILTERDCLQVVLNATYHYEYAGTVEQFMVKEVKVMAPNDNLVDAAQQFYRERYLRYPVLDNGRLVGQISRSDVMRALGDVWR